MPRPSTRTLLAHRVIWLEGEMTEKLNSAVCARIYSLARLAILALIAVIAYMANAALPAAAQNCSASLEFTSLGDTRTQSLQSCNTFIQQTEFDDSNPRWAGLQQTNGKQIRGPANCGVGVANGTGSCNRPTATTVITSNATYSITGNSATSLFEINLISRTNSAAFTDVLTYYTYVGPGTEIMPFSNTTYTFSLSVAAVGGSSDATLSDLVVSGGALVPAFSSGTVSYRIDVPSTTTTTIVTPTASDHGAVITVNGTTVSSGAASGPISLSAGNTEIEIKVSAEDGSTETYTVVVRRDTPVTLELTPPTGSLPGGTTGTAYSQTASASGGTAPYSYSVSAGALPTGLSLGSSTGAIFGTPTASGSFSFTLTATDANGATGSASYMLAVVSGLQAPVANAVSETVSANSAANPVTLSLTGGAVDSVAISTPASHGTAAASGTTITYTPAAGYSGSDSFTYTATNTAGTSAPATVLITVLTPDLDLTPPTGSLPGGTTGTAYSQTASASGGTAPYSYSVSAGALPTGLSLDSSTGAIFGTPTASGSFSFTLTATDANGAAGSASYMLAVAPAVSNFLFTPASGSTLAEAMVAEDYSQPVSAQGGKGTLTYSLVSGELPAGMVLNVSTGELTGPLAVDAVVKDYALTIGVRDSNGASGSASYALTVKPRAVTVTDKVLTVQAGATPPDVYLNRGATGGPFTSAISTFVEPANAGTATVIQGKLAQVGPLSAPVGWYLQFTPNPAYTGLVRVGFRLTSALGISNTGTITYDIVADAATVATDIDRLVHGFVLSRQALIASTIKVPGLLERRKMEKATDSVATRLMPSERGMTVNFATSLVQMESARDSADGGAGGYISPFNIWIDAAFLAHNDEEINGKGKWGTFAMINAGADYLLSEEALLGLSFHYDRMTDPTDEDAELSGNGWMAGPYASVEIGEGVFWNGSLLYGGSANDIDTEFWDGSFDTTRWMIDTAIAGEWLIGETTVLTPKLRAVYFHETVEDYSVRNAAADEIGIKGYDVKLFRGSLSAEIARSFTLENGSTLTPKLGVTGGFSGLEGNGAFGALTIGLTLESADLWMLDASLLFNVESQGQNSAGGRLRASKTF
jgi:large repetitive protein